MIYASLRFEDGEGILYFIGLYKSLDGSFYAMDYFGNPYLNFKSTSERQETEESVPEYYTTRETLFSAFPNRLYEFDFAMTRYLVTLKGRRALQGDTTLIESGQVPYVIFSEEDIKNNTDKLRMELEAELEALAAEGYFLTDIIWNVKEYDVERHLYRGELEFELKKVGGEKQKLINMECYRVADCFVGGAERKNYLKNSNSYSDTDIDTRLGEFIPQGVFVFLRLCGQLCFQLLIFGWCDFGYFAGLFEGAYACVYHIIN